MRNVVLQGSLSFAFSCLTVAVLLAQQPPPTTPQPTSPPEPPVAMPQRADDRMVTAQGCLKQEKDVPGARPNVVERAGVAEDFILTQAKLTKGESAAPQADTGRTASGAMYKVSGLDAETLRALSNQQVEVQGHLRDRKLLGGTKPTTPGPGTAPDEVQEIRAISIKMLASTCTTGTN
jgi:hypothetical protein